MKIAVFSDSHGNVENMISAIEDFRPDHVIHLGDKVEDADFIAGHYPLLPLLSVPGNCDYAPTMESSRLVELGGVRIFLAHGHRHGVKMELDAFANSVFCSGSQLGLYGHTHAAHLTELEGMQLFNPGACGGYSPTYGQIIIENRKAVCTIVKF